MKHLIASLCLLGVWIAASAEEWRISQFGYGPIKTGMSVEQAERLLGTKLEPDGLGVNPDCYHVTPLKGHMGLLLMIESHRISRVTVYGEQSRIKTDKDIGIGSSQKAVIKAYGPSAVIQQHHYSGGAGDKYLTYWNKNETRGIRFVTNNNKVESIHGGTSSIQYVEGCA